MKLRTKALLFFGTFILVIAFGIVFYADYVVARAMEAQAVEAVRIHAEQAEGAYFTFLKTLKREAVDFVASPSLQNIISSMLTSKEGTAKHNKSIQDFSAYIRGIRMPHDPSILMVDVLDKNGIVIASTKSSRIGTDELKEEVDHNSHYFSETIKSKPGEAFVKSIVFEADETTEPMVHATARFFTKTSDGTSTPLDAVLLIHFLSIKEISDVISGEEQVREGAITGKALLSTYKTSEIYFVNSEKYIVTPTRYIKDVLEVKKADTLPVRECLENGREISQEYLDYRGVTVIGASMCFVNDGLVLLVEISKDELFGHVQVLIDTTLFIVAFSTVLGYVIIVLFLRRPFRRVNAIVLALEKVMKGDLNTQLKIEVGDETGHLASMVNKMVTSVRDNQDWLKAANIKLQESENLLRIDVEEHKKQEEFLEESKRATQNLLEDSWKIKEKLEDEGHRLQAVLSSIGEGLILIDGGYHVALSNPVAAKMLGMTRDEILGRDLREFVTLWKNSKDIVPPEHWPIEQVLITKKPVESSLEDNLSLSTEKHPEKLPVVFTINPFGDTNAGAVIVVRDVSKDRELDEAKSGFISVASHQLRTPLTSIRWYSEMLLSLDAGPLNDTQKDFMKEVHSGAERLYQTVDLLLGLSRVESGKLKADRTPIDLNIFTSEIKKELSSQADEKNLNVEIFPPDREPVIVWLDPLTLRQVILNLFSNAIRYTNNQGKVEVKWWVREEKEKEEVVYSVHDNGIGIPRDAQSQVFSKFFRAENARAQVPDGSGLGLALVKELVESWNGAVWFETTEGQGTTFFFTVPLSTEVAVVPESAKIEERLD